MPPCLPEQRLLSKHDDGHCYVHDPERGRTWEVGAGTLELLHALRAGWHPGEPVPSPLHERLVEEGLSDADLPAILDDLVAQGILSCSPPAPTPAAPSAPRLFAVAPPPARWRPWIVRSANWAAPLAGGLFLLGALLAGGGGYGAHLAEPHGWLALAVFYVLGQAILIVPHELGHALVLAAATGRPVAVRLRWGGWPLFVHAFTEASLLYTVPARRVRVAVLLAGAAAEICVWTLLLFVRPLLPTAWQPLAGAAIALGGCWSLVGNLVLPIRNDGYYLLSDLARADDLEQHARAAAWRVFFSTDSNPEAGGRWWIPWYGLASAGFAPVVVLTAAVQLSRLGLSPLFLPVALALALSLFRRSFPLVATS